MQSSVFSSRENGQMVKNIQYDQGNMNQMNGSFVYKVWQYTVNNLLRWTWTKERAQSIEG